MADHDPSLTAIRHGMLAVYLDVLDSGPMTPLEALECMAGALGSIYREVADAHLDPQGCQCGWTPSDRLT